MSRMQRGVKGIVVEAGRHVFAKYGFRKTTMDEIAKATHLAKSSIYHYFRSKEDIFQAILEQEIQTALAEVQQAVAAASTPQDKLRAYFRQRLQTMQQATNFYSAVLDEYIEHFAFIEKLRKSFDVREMEIVRAILEEGVRSGEFTIASMDAALTALQAALRGIEFYFMIVEKKLDRIAEILEPVMNLLFNGIVTR